MNIILVSDFGGKKLGYSQPYTGHPNNMGLGLLAASTQQEGHNVQIVYHDPINDLRNQPDLVGFSTYTQNYNLTLEVARRIKEIYPKTLIVLGGPHVSYLQKEAISQPEVDYIVLGPGEQTFPRLVKSIANQKPLNLENIITKGNIDSYVTRKTEFYKLPWQLISPENFGVRTELMYPSFSHQNNMLFFYTSIGCTNRCSFCITGRFHDKVNFRDPTDFAEEVNFYEYHHEMNLFALSDSSPDLDWNHTIKICEALRKKGVKSKFLSSATPYLNLELARELYSAGCQKLSFGIESLNKRTRKQIGKKEI